MARDKTMLNQAESALPKRASKPTGKISTTSGWGRETRRAILTRFGNPSRSPVCGSPSRSPHTKNLSQNGRAKGLPKTGENCTSRFATPAACGANFTRWLAHPFRESRKLWLRNRMPRCGNEDEIGNSTWILSFPYNNLFTQASFCLQSFCPSTGT